jgi:hypothetical protein
MLDAAGQLLPGEYNLSSGCVSSVSGGVVRPVAKAVRVLAGGAMSSAFWAAPIIEASKLEFAAAKAALAGQLLPPLPPGGAEAEAEADRGGGLYALDGGFVDTSGISVLLRRRVDRMVVFLNKNSDLAAVNSTVSYLFGVATPTDTMNSLQGPALAQVFEAALFPEVIKNLTHPARLFASLSHVRVQRNEYFGVEPYVLSKLLIISNQYSDVFLDEFRDPEVREKLDPRWPNKFEVGMPTFDANLMCVFAGWKVNRYAAQLQQVFRPDAAH